MNRIEEIKRRAEEMFRTEKHRFLPLFLLIVALALGGGVSKWRQSREMPGTQILLETEVESESMIEVDDELETRSVAETVFASEDTLTVYVCGAVQFPGVYTLQRDRRVIDAIEAAGGFLPEADEEYWNLAESLTDGEQIRIPTREESKELEPRAEHSDLQGDPSANASDGTVNLNTASVTELMTLPGIGESKASAIIAYREEHGLFQSIEDVMKVAGIKQASFDKIKDKITV